VDFHPLCPFICAYAYSGDNTMQEEKYLTITIVEQRRENDLNDHHVEILTQQYKKFFKVAFVDPSWVKEIKVEIVNAVRPDLPLLKVNIVTDIRHKDELMDYKEFIKCRPNQINPLWQRAIDAAIHRFCFWYLPQLIDYDYTMKGLIRRHIEVLYPDHRVLYSDAALEFQYLMDPILDNVVLSDIKKKLYSHGVLVHDVQFDNGSFSFNIDIVINDYYQHALDAGKLIDLYIETLKSFIQNNITQLHFKPLP
jgi:hypothetical protein